MDTDLSRWEDDVGAVMEPEDDYEDDEPYFDGDNDCPFCEGDGSSGQRGDCDVTANGHSRCVRCGERLRQVLVGNVREWRWRCPQCGSDGGPVEVE